MKFNSTILPFAFLMCFALPTTAVADVWSKACARILPRFGVALESKAGIEFAKRGASLAARYGDDVIIGATQRVGPRALGLIERAGARGRVASELLGSHGERAAAYLVTKPAALAAVERFGGQTAAVLMKHKGVGAEVVEQFGKPALSAFGRVSEQNGRRLAMLAQSGELAMAGRAADLLDVVGKHGDKAADWLWRNKGGIAVASGCAAFLANPEPFLNGANQLATTVADSTIRPIAEAPKAALKELAANTNGTVLGVAALALGGLLLAFGIRRPSSPQPPVLKESKHEGS